MDTYKNIENVHVFKWKPLLRQTFVSSQLWVLFFMVGLCLGMPTVTIPQLQMEANSTTVVSHEMASWISSISSYVGLVWIIGLSILTHLFGRKKLLTLVSVNNLIAFIVLYYSRNVTDVLISQIVNGPLMGALATISLMMLTEYTAPSNRGVFLTIKSATSFWGIWVANAIGAFANYRYIGLVGIICSVYNVIGSLMIPESPYWLASKEKYEECEKSHRWLNDFDKIMDKELSNIINGYKNAKMHKKPKRSFVSSVCTSFRNLCTPACYKPVIICFFVAGSYHLSGKLVCAVYSIQIIKKILGTESAAYIAMLILDGFSVAGMYIGCGLSKFLSRRGLLLSASFVGVIFLYLLSIYLYLVKISYIQENNYVSIFLLTIFSLAMCCGPLILASSIFAELAPIKSRNLSFCLIAFDNIFLLSTLLKISPYLYENLGIHGAFTFFAIASTFVLILNYFYVPETKDKTLYEIAKIFDKELDINSRETALLSEKST